jgi:hypothetical protein
MGSSYHTHDPAGHAAYLTLRDAAPAIFLVGFGSLGERYIADFFAPCVELVWRWTAACIAVAVRLIAIGTGEAASAGLSRRARAGRARVAQRWCGARGRAWGSRRLVERTATSRQFSYETRERASSEIIEEI